MLGKALSQTLGSVVVIVVAYDATAAGLFDMPHTERQTLIITELQTCLFRVF
jgi:hypothetical protein